VKVWVPRRNQIIAKLPLHCMIKPLNRPRAYGFGNRVSIRQPLENQSELFGELKGFDIVGIDEPIFVDIHINFLRRGAEPKRLQNPFPIKTRQGDVDNLAKAVNDGLVKYKIIGDDIYIVGQEITKAYAAEDKATVTIWSVKPEPEEIDPWTSSPVPTNSLPVTLPSTTF